REEEGRYVGVYGGAPLPPLAIPSTLHDSLMTRLDRKLSREGALHEGGRGTWLTMPSMILWRPSVCGSPGSTRCWVQGRVRALKLRALVGAGVAWRSAVGPGPSPRGCASAWAATGTF